MVLWKKSREESVLSGQTRVLDGYSAILEAEAITSEVVGISSLLSQEMEENVGISAWNKGIEFLDSHSLGIVAGSSLAGQRSACVLGGATNYYKGIESYVSQRIPLLIHLICGKPNLGHEEFYKLSESGCFQLFASCVQEIIDFSILAHKIAEFSLTPGICAQDLETSRSLQEIKFPDASWIEEFLGSSSSKISSPTPSQEMLFGKERPEIPVWCDMDRPMTLGMASSHFLRGKSLASQRSFFFHKISEVVDQVFEEFGKSTGRYYHRVSGYQLVDADYVVVAQGAVVEALQSVVQILRAEEGIKVGVMKLTMFRPFPGEVIAQLLQGKKGVTVLERVDHPLSGDLPLLREIRTALDKALENGKDKKSSIYPDYPAYRKVTDHPTLFSAIYTGLPSLADLREVFHNMRQKKGKKSLFYVGVSENQSDARFPKLEMYYQTIQAKYPSVKNLSMSASRLLHEFPETAKSFRIHFPNIAVAKCVGDLFAQVLVECFSWKIKTQCKEKVYTTVFSEQEFSSQSFPDVVDLLVIGEHALVSTPSPIEEIRSGGILVVDTTKESDVFWKELPLPIEKEIQKKNITCYSINSQKIAREIASHPEQEAFLIPHIWIGALLASFPSLERGENFYKSYRNHLNLLPFKELFLDESMLALREAERGLVKLELEQIQDKKTLEFQEPTPPWTVQEVSQSTNTVYDLARFWSCTGHLYAQGQKHLLLTDPFIGIPSIPARTSSFQNFASKRSYLPKLIVENCTGCGMCWTLCPDSALPGMLANIETLWQAAFQKCKKQGHEFMQIPRLEKHLCQQAYKLIAKDDFYTYRTLGMLFQDAFNNLMERMKMEEKERAKVQEEFQKIWNVLAEFPIVKTQRFFSEPDKKEKGSGLLFGLAVDPISCKGCMQCVSVCPENALEPVVQQDSQLEIYQKNWEYFHSIPSQKELIQKYIDPESSSSLLLHLLDKKAYFSLVGGDNACPGTSEKTAIHLVSAAVEAARESVITKYVQKLEQLLHNLENKVQGWLGERVEIQDWESFAHSLTKTSEQDIDIQSLAQILQQSGVRTALRKERLERINSLILELKKLIHLYKEGESGQGRAKMSMVVHDKCLAWGREFPYSPFSFPCVYDPDPIGVAKGILQGTLSKMAEEFKIVRMAELELNDSYQPLLHDPFFENFHWKDFTQEEWEVCPLVVVVEDQEYVDYKGIFSLFAQQLPIKIVILEGYKEKGQDRSYVKEIQSALPFLLQKNAFILQSTPLIPGHFLSGMLEGIEHPGPALFYMYTPNFKSAGITSSQSIEHARLAVDGRVFPLWKYNSKEDKIHLSLDGNQDPERDWSQRTFLSKETAGVQKELSIFLTPAHWASREKRWSQDLQPIPKSQWHTKMKSLEEYLSLPKEKRKDFVPFIDIVDSRERHVRFMVSDDLVQFSEEHLFIWRFLQKLSQSPSAPKEMEDKEIQKVLQQREQEIQKEWAAKLAQIEQEHGAIYHQRLKNTLLAFCGISQQSSSNGAS